MHLPAHLLVFEELAAQRPRAEQELATNEPEPRRWPFRVAFILIAAILIGMVIVLPMGFGSVVDEIDEPT